MKRLVFLVSGLLLVIPILAFGCTREVPPETEIVSSCVSCHTDKDLLKQTAAPVKEVASEATSGEG
jgi:hypothetical protein